MKTVRTRTREAFQVNFALARLPLCLDAALDAGAPIVTFSWGDATPYVKRVHSAQARVGVQIATLRGALVARDAGADFIICQGVEAGGHVQASRPLDDLLGEVASAEGMPPVVAAGGLANSKCVARVLASGAGGAMLGTRFVATTESLAHERYKAALVRSTSQDSVLTVCFDGGWPYAMHRVLRNETLEAWEAAGSPPHGSRPGEGDMLAATQNGTQVPRYDDTIPLNTMRGNIDAMALYAGRGCGEIKDIPNAATLLTTLWNEGLAILIG